MRQQTPRPSPEMDPRQEIVAGRVEADRSLLPKQRRTARRAHLELVRLYGADVLEVTVRPRLTPSRNLNNVARQRLLVHAKTVKHPAQPCPSAGRRSSVRSVLKAFPACPNRFVRVAVRLRQRRGGVCLQREHCLPCSRASRGSHRPLPGRLPRRPARCISPVRRDPALSETIGLPAPRRALQAAEPSSRSTGLAGRPPSAAYRRSGETRPRPHRSLRIRDLRLAPR